MPAFCRGRRLPLLSPRRCRPRRQKSRLKSLTGGEGTFTMDLSHYDPVPPRKQQELTQAWRRVEEE